MYFISIVIIYATWIAFRKRREFVARCDQVPGPVALPLVGNALELIREPDELFQYIVDYLENWRHKHDILRFWAGPFPIFIIYTPEAAEILLSSNKLITKCREYQFLEPWLNTGLLTSTGTKWHSRRKMLTPAFHFKILEDFIEVFNEQSKVFVQKLEEASDRFGDGGFNVFPYVTRCTLDVICDTAMGRHVDAQNKNDSDYVRAVCTISRIVQTRQLRPWLQPDALFNFTSMAGVQSECLKILHGFTDQVIKERKLEHEARRAQSQKNNNDVSEDTFSFEKKPRLAFLDLLISASDDGKLLSDQDIREEVDTFMFEGHDTTAAGISWCLHLIGSHPDVQERLYDELYEVFGDSDRPVTMEDLNHLKYLECCLKESLRLYPSVPILGRTLNEDLELHGHQLPAGTTVVLFSYSLHRDPKNFPDPEKYIPERFLPENARGRHPYCYVPFSAGPRNCIGQKFALMEEKVVLATVLRHFEVQSLDKREDMTLLGELVLRPRDGVNVRLTPRKLHSG
nr:CYP4C34-like protein 2 [Diaphanosoma celebensis]